MCLSYVQTQISLCELLFFIFLLLVLLFIAVLELYRICCSGDDTDGFYELTIDGELENEGSDFGENDFVTFGDCDCAKLIVELDLGDSSESEVWQSLMIDDGEYGVEIWSRSNHSIDWSPTTTLECLDPNVCYVYYLDDFSGGVVDGNIRVEFDGEELYDGGWEGSGGFVDIGAC